MPLALLAWMPVHSSAGRVVIADPAAMLKSGERVDFVGASDLSVEPSEQGRCLRSVPRGTATGLFQRIDVPIAVGKSVEWSWRVDRLQAQADIRELNREDFGAKIAFVFGELTFWSRDVPTLAYVWTSTPVANGTVLPSARYANLRYVQLHGPREVGSWQREHRDLHADFKAAFGSEPGRLHYIAVFNDNDQTGEPTSALFGRIEATD